MTHPWVMIYVFNEHFIVMHSVHLFDGSTIYLTLQYSVNKSHASLSYRVTPNQSHTLLSLLLVPCMINVPGTVCGERKIDLKIMIPWRLLGEGNMSCVMSPTPVLLSLGSRQLVLLGLASIQQKLGEGILAKAYGTSPGQRKTWMPTGKWFAPSRSCCCWANSGKRNVVIGFCSCPVIC